ncbi:MAG: respiratory nitrate reductase subunit gamma [Candidatus Hydrothermarchaeales archaeon]
MEAMRQVFWNIPREIQIIFYVTTIIVVIVFVLGVLQRMSIWLEGEDEEDSVLHGLGLWGAVKLSLYTLFSTGCIFVMKLFARGVRGVRHAFVVWGFSFKTRVFARGVRGVMHIFLVWSFVVLFIGTLITQFNYDLHLNFLKGNFYLIFSFALDIGGLLLLIGASVLLVRRYAAKSERMITSAEDLIVLLLLFLIPLFGFIVEGLRLAVTQPEAMDWSPIGALFASLFQTVFGPRGALLRSLHLAAWLSHVSLVFILIIYIPFSKLFHMFAAQITLYATIRKYKEEL